MRLLLLLAALFAAYVGASQVGQVQAVQGGHTIHTDDGVTPPPPQR